MLISYRWLQRHVDLTDVSPERVCELFTMHTAEVEGLEPFAPVLSDVVVGHVLERAKHPDADKLSVCRVDVGAEAPLQIVCGAPNVDAGQRIAVATVGTRLPGDIKIKKGKIRGQESFGMICSERELGLGEEHSGIWVLPGEPAVGAPVAAACGIQDWIIEIDNKSLTHRPDLWGHRGLAGELAALLGRELEPIATELPPQGEGAPLPIRVEHEHCSRYLGLTIAGVSNGRSPEWMRLLLLAVGQRPLDLLVDVSNFVMLDLGQPNHLFDMRSLSSEGIVVRKARAGEAMTTLDEVERKLDTDDLLICDGERPVALAGVMGGAQSKVEGETDTLFLELASFDAACIRRTASRLALRTDASTRFEKSLDPTLPMKTAAHMVSLLAELAPELSLPSPAAEDGVWSDPAHELALRPARVRAVLGHPVTDERIQSILESLGFGVRTSAGEAWQVAVPSARSTKDVGIEEDLIEEVGRVIGYGEIEERPLEGALLPAPRDARRALVRSIQERLSGGARFHELQTYSFLHDELCAKLGIDAEPAVRVLHPASDGLARVRRSVLPNLIGLLADNLRHATEVRLYELGKGYRPEQSDERGQPDELHELALALAAPAPAKDARFDADALAALRGVLVDLLTSLGHAAPRWERVEGELPGWAHPGKSARALAADGSELAFLTALEPGVQRAFELDAEVALAQVSLDVLLAAEQDGPGYKPLPRFPGVKVDVALSLPEAVDCAMAEAAITSSGKGLVESVELFDVYVGESLGAGRKSLAFHVLLQAADKTLREKDVAKFLGRLERGAEGLGGELRRE